MDNDNAVDEKSSTAVMAEMAALPKSYLSSRSEVGTAEFLMPGHLSINGESWRFMANGIEYSRGSTVKAWCVISGDPQVAGLALSGERMQFISARRPGDGEYDDWVAKLGKFKP